MNTHIIVSIMLCTLQCEPAEVRIWDGDTFRIGSRDGESVRIFNIDAPEIEGKCRYESDLAQQSKLRLASLLKGGKIEIQRQDTDRYGRTLASVRVNGHDAGDMLVSEGLARTWSGRREPWC
ncbi:thermonuclease family protein (plasmid) [Agrobacterium leguminum]|uniref:thermonuclease family protein n=1 Tax=Agrobacterium leguminum TaxID=2792015 RepID=UPI0010C95BEA|nr:thermonuclease family protein [Agrobacterium leguminum]WFS69555.1 thermonuclease family protein [Agrobacterium leguminum]